MSAITQTLRAAAEDCANHDGFFPAYWIEYNAPGFVVEDAAQQLWRSFCGGQRADGEIGILGLLLLAEILESAE